LQGLGKNPSDRAMVIDVMDLLERKTPMPFVNACSHFLYLENLGSPEPAAMPEKHTEVTVVKLVEPTPTPVAKPAPVKKGTNELKGDARLVGLFELQTRDKGLYVRDRRSVPSANGGAA